MMSRSLTIESLQKILQEHGASAIESSTSSDQHLGEGALGFLTHNRAQQNDINQNIDPDTLFEVICSAALLDQDTCGPSLRKVQKAIHDAAPNSERVDDMVCQRVEDFRGHHNTIEDVASQSSINMLVQLAASGTLASTAGKRTVNRLLDDVEGWVMLKPEVFTPMIEYATDLLYELELASSHASASVLMAIGRSKRLNDPETVAAFDSAFSRFMRKVQDEKTDNVVALLWPAMFAKHRHAEIVNYGADIEDRHNAKQLDVAASSGDRAKELPLEQTIASGARWRMYLQFRTPFEGRLVYKGVADSLPISVGWDEKDLFSKEDADYIDEQTQEHTRSWLLPVDPCGHTRFWVNTPDGNFEGWDESDFGFFY